MQEGDDIGRYDQRTVRLLREFLDSALDLGRILHARRICADYAESTGLRDNRGKPSISDKIIGASIIGYCTRRISVMRVDMDIMHSAYD